MSYTETTNGSLVWRNAWDQDRFDDDPSVGDPFVGEQATMAARWDVRTWWNEMARRYGLTENESMVAVELWTEAVGAGRWTSYSRSDEHYAKFPKSALYTKRLICSGVDGLEKKGLVHSWRQVKYGFGWQSCTKAKPELVAMVQAVVDAIGRPYPARPKSELLLRDADGKPKKLPDTIETRKMSSELWDYNSLLRASFVDGEHATCVRRVFNESLRYGGRHYCIGLSFQRKPNFERALMTINGEKVVEYDYGSLHPCLLYVMAGLPIPEDAYDLQYWDRDLQKVGFLVMVNCDDPEVALHAIAQKPAMAAVAEPGSAEALRVAAALYDELADRHKAIASMFSTGVGRVLQRRDSDMMAAVLRETTKRKRLALPVFDSCLVAESDGDLLADLMRNVADRAGLDGIRIEKVVPKEPKSEKADSSGFPTYTGDTGETSRLMPSSFPSSSSLPSPPCQDGEQDSRAGVRPSAARELDSKAEGRSPSVHPSIVSESLQELLLRTSIPVSDSPIIPIASSDALRIDSRSDSSEDASSIESPLKSSLPRSQPASVSIPVPSTVETIAMPVDSDVLHRAAVLSAGRLVHGLGFAPRYGEKHLIRRADGPARRTVLETADDVADVWAPASGPVLVRLASRDGERSTTLVAPSRDDGISMAVAYLHGARTDGGTGDLVFDATVYGSYDPAVLPATNLRAARELVMSLPRPQSGIAVAPVRPVAAPAPVRQSDGVVGELLRQYGVCRLGDLPYGAAKLVSKPKPKREFV